MATGNTIADSEDNFGTMPVEDLNAQIAQLGNELKEIRQPKR